MEIIISTYICENKGKMATDLIKEAIAKGGKIYASISGGKDGDAMVESLTANGFSIEGLVHADLGRTEWKESMPQCIKCSEQFNLPLHVVTRADGRDMLAHWQHRMHQLTYAACDVATREEIQLHPTVFWSSSKERYCTSDMKRDPIDSFFRSTGNDLIISCEGIRAGESTAREKKIPLTIRTRITSDFYQIKKEYFIKKKGKKIKKMRFVRWMTPAEAIANFKPGCRLALTWFPIFNFSLEDVWATKGQTVASCDEARAIYKATGAVPTWWPFHPAYAYGNTRVSCMFCVLGCIGDLKNAAQHNPELLQEMIAMEDEGGATFKNGWSLKELL